jgi:8-oxo-dGTP pyrophosphatase MutT (NUDIX family)
MSTQQRFSVDPALKQAFLGSTAQLRPAHAAAALIVLADGRYVLQLRDNYPTIFYPGHWGCFGGAIEANETSFEALCRELLEELGLRVSPADCRYFTEFTFDFGFAGLGVFSRHYHLVNLQIDTIDQFTLAEGADLGAFGADEILTQLRVTPYDAFAIWLCHHGSRLQANDAPSA